MCIIYIQIGICLIQLLLLACLASREGDTWSQEVCHYKLSSVVAPKESSGRSGGPDRGPRRENQVGAKCFTSVTQV